MQVVFIKSENNVVKETVPNNTEIRWFTRTVKRSVALNDFITNMVFYSNLDEPETLAEMAIIPNKDLWMKAIQDDHNSIIENNTWVVADYPSDKKPTWWKMNRKYLYILINDNNRLSIFYQNHLIYTSLIVTKQS